MKDLVERQAVTDLIMENDPWWCEGMTRTIFDGIDRLPSIDAEPVRHGKWIYTSYYTWECSECKKNPTLGFGYVQSKDELFKYCPNCGARMDAERKEK